MQMIKNEFKFIFHNKLILLSTIVIMIIPFLYCIFFLKSVWDPYGHTGDLPVAVVNEDRPVRYQGKTMAVGKQTVKELKQNDQLQWHFVSKHKAAAGLKHRKYYTVITIPADFSKNATTVLSTSPKKMHLTYKTNDSLNYIGRVISDMGAKQLNTQIREQVTKAYAKAVFQQLKTVGTGMKSAAKAETQLHDGTVTLNDGLNLYAVGVNQVNSGVQTLKVKVVPLANGINQLASGGSTLTTAIQSYTGGVGQVNSGLQQLTANSSQLTSGVASASSGNAKLTAAMQQASNQIGSQLSSNQSDINSVKTALTALSTLVKGVSSGNNADMAALNTSLASFNANSTQIKTALTTSGQDLSTIYKNVFNTSNTESTAAQLQQAGQSLQELQTLLNSDGYKKMAAADPATAAQIATAVNQVGTNVTNAGSQLSATSNSLSDMQSNLTSVGTKLSESSSQLTGLSQKLTTLQTQLKQVPLALDGGVQAITELETGLETVKQGLDQRGNTQSTMGLIQASQTLNSGLQQIQTGLNAYTSGVSQAQSGTQTLVNNSAALNSGSGQLSSGLSQMNSQVPTLTSGVNQLASGTQTLANNSGQLTSGATQLASGSGELQSALSSGSAKINSIHPNAQTAAMFAAPSTLNHQSYSHVSNYGHALAPYVLSVALYVGCLVFNFVYPIRKISMTGHSPKEWFASKVVVSGLVAIGMAVIETALMMAAGLNADHPAQMFLIATIFSLASMYVIMFFSMAFDNPGRFVAMVLLMLQLGGSGGTFPMEVTNSFFNAIHPWLPMTYSILGFRQALTSGIGNQVIWQVTGVLLIFAIVGLICLLLSMIVLQKMHWQGKSQLDNNQKLQDVEK